MGDDDPLPKTRFPEPFTLSSEQQEALVHEADTLIAETLLANEDFIANGRQLDPHNWKFYKSKFTHQIYYSRKKRTTPVNHSFSREEGEGEDIWEDWATSSLSSTSSNNSIETKGDPPEDFMEEYQKLEYYLPPHTPLIVANGTIEGTVDDAAFGALADNYERTRLRSLYISHHSDPNHRILAKLENPNEEDPYRFTGIKWTLRDFRPFFKQQRDVLFLEAAGMAYDSNGDKVHYILQHSIPLEQVPEFTEFGIVRLQTHICAVHRQLDSSTVERFCRIFFSPGSEVLDRRTSLQIAEAFFTASTVVECSYVKKLTWLMKHKSKLRLEHGLTKSEKIAKPTATYCHACAKCFNKEVAEDEHPTGWLCQVCYEVYCSLCSVSKDIAVTAATDGTTEKLGFCLRCILEAKQLPAWDIALATLGSQ